MCLFDLETLREESLVSLNRMMIGNVVAVVAAFSCLLNTSPVNAQATTCGVNSQCSSCQGDKVKTFPGTSTKICCKQCRSKYFNYGTSSSGANYCNCNFDRVSGASKGEQCDAAGMTTYFHLNGMPICCPDPQVGQYLGQSSGVYTFSCAVNGNCWRGTQCASCNSSYVGSMNGVNLCCANCEASGLIIGPGTHCSCNNGS